MQHLRAMLARYDMMTANLMIVAGTLLIAIGGIVATKGWNDRDFVAQRARIIRSVAAEWVVNMAVLNDPKFTETKEENLVRYTVFPRMQISAVSSAVASGVFSGENDRLFLTHAAGLSEILDDFNRRLTLTEDAMRESPDTIARSRKKLRDGRTRRDLCDKLVRFGELLISDCGIKLEDSFFVRLDE